MRILLLHRELQRPLTRVIKKKVPAALVTGGTCTEVQIISKGVIRWRAAESSDCKSNRE